LARAAAWLGRGLRTPVRKALLAAAVTPETYGRAFGFERMLDTVGAIVGPATALWLLGVFDYHYPSLFAITLVPGLMAVGVVIFLVAEKQRAPVPHISFGDRLRILPTVYRRFLLSVGLFGAGDFAHTLLILLATQRLIPVFGTTKAASLAVALYVFHNIFYAAFAFIAGWLADRFRKNLVLASGYALATVMALLIIALPASVWMLGAVFVLGGIYVGIEETLEDSLCAELVDEAHHGMAFGVLATVNGIGDFLSSTIVGLLWSVAGTTIAFAYSAVLFFAGAVMVARLRAGVDSLGRLG
jgi:MFS family permease